MFQPVPIPDIMPNVPRLFVSSTLLGGVLGPYVSSCLYRSTVEAAPAPSWKQVVVSAMDESVQAALISLETISSPRTARNWGASLQLPIDNSGPVEVDSPVFTVANDFVPSFMVG